MRNNLRAALGLAELDWAVFPLHSPSSGPCDCGKADCTSPSKHPRTRQGRNDASADYERVLKWWRMWPAANIGVATGEESGIVVVDVDPRHGGDVEWAKLCEQYAYDHAGPIAATGGGGWHYFFANPTGTVVQSRNAGFADGIDVKARGGYIVAPPSVHATGVSYEWIEGAAGWDLPCPDIPAWLLALMTKQHDALQRAEPLPEMIPEGQRHDRFVSIAATMRARNLSEAGIYAGLMAENLEKCAVPMSATEIAKIAAWAGSLPPGEATIVPKKKGAVATDQVRQHVPEPFNLASLQHLILPEPKWAVAGILPEGCTMLAGAAKLGKSLLSMNLAIAISQGGLALEEIPVDDGDVLYLALEDTKRRLRDRVKKMMPPDEAWPERAWVEIEWPRLGEGGLEAIDQWLGHHPLARLVIIDTLAMFKPSPVGMKRGDVYAEDYNTVVSIKKVADRHSVAILVITHLNKGDHQDYVNAMQGSAGVSGGADTLMNLNRQRGQEGQKEASLKITGRDVEEADYGMQLDQATLTWKIVGDMADLVQKREEDALLTALKKLWVTGIRQVTPSDVADLTGRKRDTEKRALGRAVTAGNILRIRDGVFGLLDRDIPPIEVSVPAVPVSRQGGGTSGTSGTSIVQEPLSRPLSDSDQPPTSPIIGTNRGNRDKEAEGLVPATEAGQGAGHVVPVCPACGGEMTLRTGGRRLCAVCDPFLTVVENRG